MRAFDGVAHKPTETRPALPRRGRKIDDTYLTGRSAIRAVATRSSSTSALSRTSRTRSAWPSSPSRHRRSSSSSSRCPSTWRQRAADTTRLTRKPAERHRCRVPCSSPTSTLRAAAICSLTTALGGMVVDPHAEQFFGVDAAGLERVKEELLNVNNRAGGPPRRPHGEHACVPRQLPLHVGLRGRLRRRSGLPSGARERRRLLPGV